PGILIASDISRADPDAPMADVSMAAAGLIDFATDLYANLAEQDGNLVFSPVSVYLALAMTYAGAAGSTAEEMAETLGDELDEAAFHSAVNVLDQALEARNREATEFEGPVELSLANSLWGQAGMTFEQAFLDLLGRDYGAGIRLVDFIDPAAREEARLAINNWVAGETNDRIEELVAEGVLDAMMRLVLVNAVYLNAAWMTPFEEEATSEGDFHLLDGSVTQTQLMNMSTMLRFAEGASWRAVELPYAGNELAMLVIVPDEGSFADVETALEADLLDSVTAGFEHQQVMISLPKFDVRFQVGLIPALRAMGLTEATGSSADFSGMTGGKDLFISDVVHEAWISADEAGTEAAAATAVMMSLTAAPAEPIEFVVDRPFLFVLHDIETGSILFMGRVVDPST
ncbi:MAG: serpin family protein, partial [Acidimicrobiia bacterium]|nr:serpin family protein [Acidimicrobiia bacterium]